MAGLMFRRAYDGIYQNANHSVRVSDAFMKAVGKGAYSTKALVSGESVEQLDAEILDMIARDISAATRPITTTLSMSGTPAVRPTNLRQQSLQ